MCNISVQEKNDDATLKHMPDMSKDQIDVLNNHLQETVVQVGMSPEDLETRRTIQVLVSDLVSANLKGNDINTL